MSGERVSELKVNPFSVKTPENLSPEELVDLFVPYPEYENLQVSGHQFLHGHRGSGKSMMLKMMTPDAQCLALACSFKDLPFYGAYLSIKATEVNSAEYSRIEGEPSGFILSEHVLVTKILSALFVSIKRHSYFIETDIKYRESLANFATSTLYKRLRYVGWEQTSIAVIDIDTIIDIFDELQADTVRYIKQRAFSKEYCPYNGPLLGFQDVLLPVVQALRNTSILPDCPVFFLLDDADNLTLQQTKVLNTWVSYRSTDLVSLKISTQMGYKTYRTSSGIKIEAPHDYSEINFTSVYTGSLKENYPKLVEQIVEKRLNRVGLKNIKASDFFPADKAQEEAIRIISDEIKGRWETSEVGGYRASDDAYRFARPEYIRRLSGVSKSGATYKYAGFEQLVHISSGIIRFFLEPAARMFADQQKANAGEAVGFIAPSIQDDEIRKQSDELLIAKFDEMRGDAQNDPDITADLANVDRLKNLIQALGSLFQAFLMDKDASQRRVFSFVISDSVPHNLEEILNMGVRFGYLYEDATGRKTGMGRTKLYVLSRRLAPAFKLDPIGFSNYLSLTSKFLLEISERPNSFVSRLRKQGPNKAVEAPAQLTFLEDLDND
ncbi:ORC-CDC6 family AAA ATPase [Pseudomonas gingeri]|uniref:ORC-CDC6 family AAA ATPase n=1 Tax=Pseudomonas gingeri TaxID=117681 RepID=UPI0015A27433|nr:hypothetical protein [Pseudomonas gingeri]NWD09798.1 hypothetical protein [Pseudomonas gingeri]NWE36748.1 hypothetical protein [Pseudomonas gingeri]NWE61103.1 hypothetical protein [Pseudomonas gingeri]NWF05930.1 hypothetical protein [Pseudomonas gingeri]